MIYERDPQRIYARSFEIVRSEADLGRFPGEIASVFERIVHACGMPEICDKLLFSPGFAIAGRRALESGAPVICDSEMTAAGIIRKLLPAQNPVITTLNEPAVREDARNRGTTRSAAAVDLWMPSLGGSVVAIGTAPTALFRLLELLDGHRTRPAVIVAFPVGFVGAAESKSELAGNPRGSDFLTLAGRRGGSAMASAAVNALCTGLASKHGKRQANGPRRGQDS